MSCCPSYATLTDVGTTCDTTPDAINSDRPVLDDSAKPTMSPMTDTVLYDKKFSKT